MEPALAPRVEPCRELQSVQGAPKLATVKVRSGDGLRNQEGFLHRRSRTAPKRDPRLRKPGLRNLQKTVQENP